MVFACVCFFLCLMVLFVFRNKDCVGGGWDR